MSSTFRNFARERVIIISAPNGARRTKADHPALPLTAEQMAQEAKQLVDQQVTVLHLHVRDRDGGHSLDAGIYRDAISAVRKAVGSELIIQVTSESVGIYSRQEQMEMVRSLRPEAVSLALRELCPDEDSEAEAAQFYGFLQDEGIWPQHILYTPNEVNRFDRLRKRGVLGEEQPFCLMVLGNYAGAIEGSPEELNEKKQMADFNEFPWAVCCFGGSELQSTLAATAQGGHVRLGFENNIHLSDGTLADSNSALIEQYRQAIFGLERTPANIEEVRKLFLTNS